MPTGWRCAMISLRRWRGFMRSTAMICQRRIGVMQWGLFGATKNPGLVGTGSFINATRILWARRALPPTRKFARCCPIRLKRLVFRAVTTLFGSITARC